MSNFTVIYDACVLYPAALRDLLMHLALSDLYRAKWSEGIHNEWISNVLKNRPDLTKAQLLRTKKLMDENVRDCLVSGYESIIPTITLPDDNDKHVLAAAIRSSASVIVTFNLKDFPKEILNQYEMEAQHPDEFVMHLLDLNPGKVCHCIKKHRATLQNPYFDVDRYLKNLTKQSLVKTVNFLNSYREIL